jgi:hypothetical protein
MSDHKKDLPSVAEELAKVNENALQKVVDARAERKHSKMSYAIIDTNEDGDIRKTEDEKHPLDGTILSKSIVNLETDLKRGGNIQRLAFEEDPTEINYYQSLWVPKIYGVPDHILKQISYRDSLVATILNTRSNQVSAFGRELQDRFATGFRIEPRPGIMEDANDEQKELLQKRIEDASHLLSTCGSLEGVHFDERMSLATFLGLQTRNGLVFGRFATEVIFTRGPDGSRKFHSFRPVDAGTIYRAAPRHDSVEAVREQALALLQRLKGDDANKLKPEKFENDEYAWVQVINGKPRQAFTPEELIVHTLYPSTDIELRGYPVTPLETVIDGVATHMNITQHNKLYFQSGRAARGMVVIKSTDIDQGMVAQIRQHFNASINNVSNAWRVPVFGIDPEDSVEWAPFDMQGGRDMEFQYLSDQNAREICSAFNMSPEELPGYQHLSRGTNSQALSESSNEYKLEAARDIGIRPLLNQFQDFLNDHILPLIDPRVAKLCSLKLYGLDADTEEKEDTQLTNRMQIDLSLDEILERKEKDPVGKEWAGRFPFNPAWQSILDKYFTVGEIMEHFFDKKGASKDPNLQYFRDPFFFQWLQLQMQQQQMQQEAQAQQQQAQQGRQEPEGDNKGGDQGEKESELATGADQVMDMLGKSERQLPPNKRRLLGLHKKIVKDTMDAWEKDSKEAIADVLATVKQHGD